MREQIRGLYNRGYFNELLRAEFKRYERYRTPFSVVIIEIKEKKRENLDQRITFWGNLLKRFSRESDVLARFGVDKFAVLLPDTTLDNVTAWEERIVSHVSGEEAVTYRISVPDECNSYDEFWMLYRIKMLGERSTPLKYVFASPPFTGYEKYLNTIKKVIEKKKFPVKIYGPFGVGKTTLVKIAGKDYNILEISCSPQLSEVPLYTLRNLLMSIFNHFPKLVRDAQTELNKDEADLINTLVQGLDIKIVGEEGAIYNTLQHSLLKIFTHKEIVNDTLVVIKGAQWIDKPTLKVLRNLLVSKERLPFVFIWDEAEEILDNNDYSEIPGYLYYINGFDDKEADDFISKISENKVSLSPEEKAIISGIPLFLKEALFNKIYVLPENINHKEDIFLKRLDKLDRRTKEVLYLLALTDEYEAVNKLQHCLGLPEIQLWDKLDNLLTYGLIEFDRDGNIKFVHRVIPYIIGKNLPEVKRNLICDRLGKVLKEEMSYPKEFYTFYLCNGLNNELNGIACIEFDSLLQKFKLYEKGIYYLNKALVSELGTVEKARIWTEIGKHFIKMGDFKKAEEVLKETAVISPESHKWEVFCTMGELSLLKGDLEKAHEFFRKAELFLKNDALKPYIDVDFARILIEKHRYKRAKSILEKVIKKMSLQYPEVLSKAYGYLSLVSAELGNTEDARYYLKEMNKYCEKAGYKICNTEIQRKVAVSFFELGKLSMCDEIFLGLLKLTKQHGSIENLGEQVLSYLDFLLDVGDMERFRNTRRKYSWLFKIADSPRIQCSCSVTQGRYLMYYGNYSKACSVFKKAEELAKKYEFYDLLTSTYIIMGELGLMQKEFELAGNAIGKALKIVKKSEHAVVPPLLYYYKAFLEREKNDLVTAMEFAKVALKEASQSGKVHLVPLIYLEMAMISIISGRKKRALNYFNKARSSITPYKDTIYYLYYLSKTIDFYREMGEVKKAETFRKLLTDLAEERGVIGLIR